MPKVSLVQIIWIAELGLGFTLTYNAYPGIYIWYSWVPKLAAKHPTYDLPTTINWLCGITLVIGLGLLINTVRRAPTIWPDPQSRGRNRTIAPPM